MSRTERNWEAGTDPRLRRGVGGEPVAPEAAGARRAGRGDGERRHGALQRRHPSHPLAAGLAHLQTAHRITHTPLSSSPEEDNARFYLLTLVGCIIHGPTH